MQNDRFKNPIFHYSMLTLIIITGLLTLGYHTVGHLIPRPSWAFSSCSQRGAQHELFINNGNLNPAQIQVRRCDTIIFINLDEMRHELALATSQHHQHYPGFQQKVLAQNEQQKFTFRQIGEYIIHDHLDASVYGKIVIIN